MKTFLPLCGNLADYFRRKHACSLKFVNVSQIWKTNCLGLTGCSKWALVPSPIRKGRHSCTGPPWSWVALPATGGLLHRLLSDRLHPPCPSDDADLVELEQELGAVGDFRHRSPSRSLSVPSRPRPPHPPQRPPPPSKTLLDFGLPRCLLGIIAHLLLPKNSTKQLPSHRVPPCFSLRWAPLS